MAFMQEKEAENLINLYKMETSLWDTNDETYYDADKRLQALEEFETGRRTSTVQHTGDCCGS